MPVSDSPDHLPAQALQEENRILRERLTLSDRALVESEKARQKLRQSATWQVGTLAINALRSPLNFFLFPLHAFRLWCRYNPKYKGRLAGNDSDTSLQQVLSAYAKGGIDKALERIDSLRLSGRQKAQLCVDLAQRFTMADAGDLPVLARFLSRQEGIPPAPVMELAAMMMDHGHISAPCQLILPYRKNRALTFWERGRVERLEGLHRLMTAPPAPETAEKAAFDAGEKKILYMLASAMPFHRTGYTMRSKIVIDGLKGNGWAIHCATRPGYPLDRKDIEQESPGGTEEEYDVEGVPCTRFARPRPDTVRPDVYIAQSALAIEQLARRVRPSQIMAASNYMTAYPAMLAARRLGLPFIYEVRGVWEYTTASKRPSWENSERFHLDGTLEDIVLSHADSVVTLGEGLKQHLLSRGVPADKIFIAANCADMDLFKPEPRNEALARQLGLERFDIVIGYAGTFSHYEGLDDLLSAMHLLNRQDVKCGLLLIGHGEGAAALPEKIRKAGLTDQVVLQPPVEQQYLAGFMSVADCVILPRKDYEVCHIVTPLKPVEAMAMGRPLIVSDVRALKELVVEGETGLTFPAGNVAALASAIARLAQDGELRRVMGENARRLALRQYDKVSIMKRLSAHIEGVGVKR